VCVCVCVIDALLIFIVSHVYFCFSLSLDSIVMNSVVHGTSSTSMNESKIHVITPNLGNILKSNESDDYPTDNEFDYSDYAYEDSVDQTIAKPKPTISTTTTTTMISTQATITSTTVDDDVPLDDTHTAYYDYGDHDVYSDDEIEDSSTTTKHSTRITSTQPLITTTKFNWRDRIPYYHRRPPVIWNVNNDNAAAAAAATAIDDADDDDNDQRNNSGTSLGCSLLLTFVIYMVRV
jgi:hypothetical protein